ncbi:ribonuclease HI [Candidatus Nomurabacteria bacterium]|nr:ribonuclease HI [Candidatus Nomurabacteria bacterium]USN94745.1 MAG: ribonuclease HI [Candidatus Nomurabacteria bacterium]
MQVIDIYTDGSSRGNPGRGGWGSIVCIKPKNKDGNTDKIVELGGFEEATTNNRMELTAIKESLSHIEKRKIEGEINIFTDSSYALNGLSGWMYGWEKNGWKTSTGEDVLNKDIWQELLGLFLRIKRKNGINMNKVKGHSGVLLNERADDIATMYADKEHVFLFTGSRSQYEALYKNELKEKKTKTPNFKAYSYVSLVGGKVFIDKSWEDCKKRVSGKSGVLYKKSRNEEDEKRIIEEFRKS